MKIISKGKDIQPALYEVDVYTITCEECGCLFEAQDTELYDSGGFTMYRCPNCHEHLVLKYNYTKETRQLPFKEIEHYDCLRHSLIH